MFVFFSFFVALLHFWFRCCSILQVFCYGGCFPTFHGGWSVHLHQATRRADGDHHRSQRRYRKRDGQGLAQKRLAMNLELARDLVRRGEELANSWGGTCSAEVRNEPRVGEGLAQERWGMDQELARDMLKIGPAGIVKNTTWNLLDRDEDTMNG